MSLLSRWGRILYIVFSSVFFYFKYNNTIKSIWVLQKPKTHLLVHKFNISSSKEHRSLTKGLGGFYMPECFWQRCQRWHCRPANIRKICKGRKAMWDACLHLTDQKEAAGWDSLHSRDTYVKMHIFSWRGYHVLNSHVIPHNGGDCLLVNSCSCETLLCLLVKYIFSQLIF